MSLIPHHHRILFREEIIAPIPPLTLQLQGNTYILSAHEDVRQFIHDFKDDSNSATILLENTTDLGTHQKASLAKVGQAGQIYPSILTFSSDYIQQSGERKSGDFVARCVR